MGLNFVYGITKHLRPPIVKDNFSGLYIPIPHTKVCTLQGKVQSFFTQA